MSMIPRISLLAVLTISAVFGALSCGGYSSNNDQGTSFLAFGWSDDGTATNLTGLIAPLATDQAGFNNGNGQFDGQTATVFIGLQNRLTSQFIRVIRIDCDYDVAGKNGLLSLPSDSYNSSSVLGPVAIDGDTNTTPQITSANVPNESFVQFEILSPDVYSFLNVNRNYLPQLPFRMTATCRAVGVTQAGDTLVTNDLNFFIQFVDSAECCTGAAGEVVGVNGGFQGGTGNGGGITFEDGTTSIEGTTGAATLSSSAVTSDSSTTDAGITTGTN